MSEPHATAASSKPELLACGLYVERLETGPCAGGVRITKRTHGPDSPVAFQFDVSAVHWADVVAAVTASPHSRLVRDLVRTLQRTPDSVSRSDGS